MATVISLDIGGTKIAAARVTGGTPHPNLTIPPPPHHGPPRHRAPPPRTLFFFYETETTQIYTF